MRIVEGRLVYGYDWIGHCVYLLIREKDLLPLLTPKERKEWDCPLVKSWWLLFWKSNYKDYISLFLPDTDTSAAHEYFINNIVRHFNCLEKPLTLKLYWYTPDDIKDSSREPIILEIGRREVLDARKALYDYITNGGELDTSVALELLDEEEFSYSPIPKKPWHYCISRYFINSINKEQEEDYSQYSNVSLETEIDSL